MALHLVLLHALWLLLPAYFANMSPVFMPRIAPIDGGRIHKDGRRVLGDGKTWGGLLLGPAAASLVLLAFWKLTAPLFVDRLGLPSYGSVPVALLMFYVIGLGALTGDAVESYAKRRRGLERGAPWIPFDQLDFIVGSVLFGIVAGALVGIATGEGNWFLTRWGWTDYAFAFLVTPVLHLLVNWIGYKIGKKDVPW